MEANRCRKTKRWRNPGRGPTAARWGRLPACAWIYLAVTAVVLAVDAVAGPFAKDTGAHAAYIAMPGALIAAFVEVFVFGNRSKIKKEEDTK